MLCCTHLQVATFIVQKILLDDVGLRYICATAERFFAVGSVLANMVVSLADQPSTRLLKHIIRCYLRLSDNPRFVLSLYYVKLVYTILQMLWVFELPLSMAGPVLHCKAAFLTCSKMGHSITVLGLVAFLHQLSPIHYSALPQRMICEVILTIGVLWTQDDPTTRRWLQQLLHNVTGGGGMGGAPQPGLDHMMGI